MVRLSRSERLSWRLHRQISRSLDPSHLEQWRPTLTRNLEHLREGVQGEPHERNLRRWEELIERDDLLGLHRVLNGLDRDSITMREVGPFSGLLSPEERSRVLEDGCRRLG